MHLQKPDTFGGAIIMSKKYSSVFKIRVILPNEKAKVNYLYLDGDTPNVCLKFR